MNLDEFVEWLELSELRRSREEFRERLPLVLRLAEEVLGGYFYEKLPFGGYVGEKLSKDSPDNVWEGLKRMGVTQIIDLRYKYKYEVFKSRCGEHGIKYFSYPLHNDPETIANMVQKFDDFSVLIREGHFYMMGHKSSYIALCVNWAFGSNAGLYPIEFRHLLTKNNLVMKKTLPILNAIAKYRVENLDEFFDRKKYADELQERIREFKENPYPKKVWFSIVNFTRGFRNGAVVYDISVDGLGVVGYLYPSSHNDEVWEYDITLRPSVSGKARSFAGAQLKITRHLCESIPQSIKYPALPQSMKMAIGILQKTMECYNFYK